MKTKNCLYLSSALLLLLTATIPSMSVSAQFNDTPTISPMADIIVWKYQEYFGILHKRQYNVTKAKWIGVWVPVE